MIIIKLSCRQVNTYLLCNACTIARACSTKNTNVLIIIKISLNFISFIGKLFHILVKDKLDFGYLKFGSSAEDLVYYFDDKVFTSKSGRSLQNNAYKLKYSCSTNNITYFGSKVGDWKFSTKLIDTTEPAHYISTYASKSKRITFECIRYSELSKRDLMKELWVSCKSYLRILLC